MKLFSARYLALLVCCAFACAQALPIEQIQLRGNRFRGLSYREMTAEQKTMLDHTVNSARAVTNTTANGPFNVLLRSPEIGDLSQQLGNRIRFTSNLNGKLRELVTLMAGRAWTSRYEWYAHARYARDEGIPPAVLDAISRHVTPDFNLMSAEEISAWRISDELLYERRIQATTFDDALKVLGGQRLASVVSLAAYYEYVSMLLNLDGYPLPADAVAPEIPQPLPQAALYRKPRGPVAPGFAAALQTIPEIAQSLEALGAAVNREPVLPAAVRRAALDAVLHQWRYAARTPATDPAADAASKLSAELLSRREVSDTTFLAARAQLGERGLVNLIVLLGHSNIACAQAALTGSHCTFDAR